MGTVVDKLVKVDFVGKEVEKEVISRKVEEIAVEEIRKEIVDVPEY